MRLWWMFVLVFLGWMPSQAMAQRAALRPADRAVIRVRALFGEQYVSGGTAFFVTNTGLAATAAHVVAGADVIVGISAVSGDVFRLNVLVLDEVHDLAILEAPGVVPPATISMTASLGAVSAGDQISISGYSGEDPREIAPAITVGYISRSLSDGAMELNASVNPGQSGGPALSANGVLLGVVSARTDPSSGVMGVAFIRPRDQLATALALASAGSTGANSPRFASLMAFLSGSVTLPSLTYEEIVEAFSGATRPHEVASVIAATRLFFSPSVSSDPRVEERLGEEARALMSRYPQLLVFYPSLARYGAGRSAAFSPLFGSVGGRP